MADESTALILGASRGLGLALVEEFLGRGHRVIGTVRSPSPALDKAGAAHPGRLEVETVDITDTNGLRTLRQRLEERSIDVVIVNAGIALSIEKSPAQVDDQDFVAMMLTNALAPVRAIEVLEDLVPADGVLAVMSSELGSIEMATGFWQLYSASKAALNMLMKSFVSRRAKVPGGDSRAVLLLAPGWVRTDMGGAGALYGIEESIPKVVDVVEASRGVPGLRFVDRFGEILPW
ncbi:MAG TPA: SDR family NAD(P)-dependent oxidoreductase [Sphingobium sp.]|uniref:SDR family NAD(P)-dependent oxidoreductase n=1 Tax=Sphingobium sp. TaxID=1912891 RepID=UPI002ECFB66B